MTATELLKILKRHLKVHRRRIKMSVSDKVGFLVDDRLEININSNDREDFDKILNAIKELNENEKC